MMHKGLKLALTGALFGATLATAVPTEALAGPMSAPDRSVVAPSSPVDNVWYRRGWRRGYYNPGAAVAAGVGLGLLGAGLAASSGYYDYPYGYGYGYYPGYYYNGWGYPGYGGGWGW